MQQTPAGPRDWEAIVKSQPDTLFLPENLLESAKEWHKNRLAFNAAAQELAKKEAHLGHQFQDLIFAIRTEIEKRGSVTEVWGKDVGFNTEALREGKFIISFTEAAAFKQ